MRRLQGMFDAGSGLGMLALALMMWNMPGAAAQGGQGSTSEHVASESAPSYADTAVTRGKAFSATRYSRTVRILPDGKEQFLRNERYPSLMARDAEGRIYIQDIDPLPECDQPESQKPPICPVWSALVFDPATHTVVHWPEGERAAHAAVTLRMSSAQVDEAEQSTSAMPADALNLDLYGAEVTTEDLGEKTIEGVRVNGSRTTLVLPAGHAGNPKPIVTIHEVWISTEMNLIVKIIDGNPHGRETISGLEHISLQPDAGLFLPPDGYTMEGPRKEGMYLERDMPVLDGWFVSQPAAKD